MDSIENADVSGGTESNFSTTISLASNPNLYEIHTLVWLSELSQQFGTRITLGTVPDDVWDALAAQGWNLIWLMGVWERSPASAAVSLHDEAARAQFTAALPGWKAEQVVGSPYAVRNYAPDPRAGSWEDLDRARAALHQRGIGLILDFVPNHTALDHPWTRAHPEYYIRGTEEDLRREPANYFVVQTATGARAILAHGRDPYFPPWTDVAQLNFFSEAARAALILELRNIAQHCDGLRCDMAMLSLNDIFQRTWGSQLAGLTPPREEFWTSAIRAVPHLIWLGEVYWNLEPRILDLGFQYVYDKTFCDLLSDSCAEEFAERLRATAPQQGRMAHFLENHDEPRSAAVFGIERLPAAAALLTTMPGLRLFYEGQLEGSRIRLPIQISAAAAHPPDFAIQQLYETLLRISRGDPFHTGVWQLLNVTSACDGGFVNLTAYEWCLPDSFCAVVANPAGVESQGRVHFPGKIVPGVQYVFFDQLNNVRYLRDGSEISSIGLYVRLAPHQAHIFRIQPG
jgi:hypothetical protein